jgi:hypothetical protein
MSGMPADEYVAMSTHPWAMGGLSAGRVFGACCARASDGVVVAAAPRRARVIVRARTAVWRRLDGDSWLTAHLPLAVVTRCFR